MRILMIMQWFEPEPIFKGLAFAKELIKMGHDVEVLTGFPNYPGGKLYKGYRVKLIQREEIEGVAIIRVPLYPSHDSSSIGRMVNYISFALSAALIGTIMVKKADVTYVYHPPATVGLAALFMKLFRGIPFIYDIQDLWPDSISASGMLKNKIALALVDKWCNYLYKRACKIVVLSPGFKKELIKRGVPSEKIEIIYNWCDENAIKPLEPNPVLAQHFDLHDKFIIIFAGNMGKAQNLETVLSAALIMKDINSNVQFVFIGGGIEVDTLRNIANKKNLKNVTFLPYCPPSKVAEILSLADVLLVHLKDDPLFRITIPSKTQSYMAAGRPILMAVNGDAAELVERAGAGLTCFPDEPNSIVETIREFTEMDYDKLKQMGQSGRRFYERELSLNAGVKKFEEVFLSVTNKK